MNKDDFWFLCLLAVISPALTDLERNIAILVCCFFLLGYLLVEWLGSKEKNK